MTEIFLDTETTGLSPENDKIVEIACVETSGLIPTKRVFHKIINPKKKVSEEAFKVHGFSDDFLSTKPTFSQISDEFLSFIKEKKIIIHNAPFDLNFLDNELLRINKPKIQNTEIIDSLEVARKKFPGSSNSLDSLCKRFGINLSKRTKHNALLDCELLREVYINLVDAKEPKLSFSSKDTEVRIDKSSTVKDYFKKVVEISEKELSLHKDFLKKDLKKNFY